MKIQMATLVAAAAFTGVASAGVIVDTLPANNQANLSADAGQTFTTGSLGAETNLATIVIEGPQTSVAGETLSFALELFVDGDGDHSTWDPGAVLGTSSFDTVVAGGATTTAFNFSGVTLADNTVYGFRYVDAGGVASGARTGLTNATGISDGSLFSGGVQPFGGAFDTAMQIRTNVPEPGSLALLGLGGLAMLRRRRA